MQRLKTSGAIRSTVIYLCLTAVVLVAGVQAAHIHRDWLNPHTSGVSGHLTAGAETHCVLCVGSFAATVAPHVGAVEVPLAPSGEPAPPVAVFYDHRAAIDITIRPPPAL